MNDEQKGFEHTAEQWAAFERIWGETFSKLFQAGMTFNPEAAPPEFLRQMRTGIFQALAQAWDQYLRSPQFMEATKQWMDGAMAFRRMSNEFFAKVHRDTQSVSREDVDAILVALRHLETRVLDQTEALSAQIAALRQRVDGKPAPEAGATPKAARPRGTRRK
jgi:hypothetical protein